MLTGNTDGVTTNVEFVDTAIRKVGSNIIIYDSIQLMKSCVFDVHHHHHHHHHTDLIGRPLEGLSGAVQT